MSQEFKFKYDEMRGNDPGSNTSDNLTEGKEYFYEAESNTRNLCFVLEDGCRIFINYSYLISGEYSPSENTITLTFTTHTFTLKGTNLQPLFYHLMHHSPKQIMCHDARYNATDMQQSVVNKIIVNQAT